MATIDHVKVAMREYGVLHIGTNFKSQPECYSNSNSRSYLSQTYSLRG